MNVILFRINNRTKLKSSNQNSRVIIVDDHTLFADGFTALLKKFKNIDVIASYRSGEDFLKDLEKTKPDIVFMDICLLGMNGIDTTKETLKRNNNIKVVAVTESDDGLTVDQMLKAGVSAYVTKNLSWQELKTAFEKIKNGEKYITPGAALNYTHIFIKSTGNGARKLPLSLTKNDFSERDVKIIKLIELGKKEKEMADILHISVKTIEASKKKIANRMGVKKSTEILSVAFKLKILP